MIWLKSLPGPRIIEVQCWLRDEYDFCYSDCPIPTALLVNREAANRREPRYFLSGLGELLRHNGNYYRENRSPEQKTDC
jgi:hypothetical protein